MELPAGIRIVRQMHSKSMTTQAQSRKLLMRLWLRFASQKIELGNATAGRVFKWDDEPGYRSNLRYRVSI